MLWQDAAIGSSHHFYLQSLTSLQAKRERMIDPKTIKQLVKLMTDNDLIELDLEDEGQKIRLRRGSDQPAFVTAAPPSAPAVAPAAPVAATPATSAAEEGTFIRSPMVGSFYAASSPDAEPFVKVGDTVSADSVVCIVEAMKVFNEIQAEVKGTIAEILVENGQAVEFDQPLFRLK